MCRCWCGKYFEVVAIGTDYYIRGCPEHPEFDEIIYFSPFSG